MKKLFFVFILLTTYAGIFAGGKHDDRQIKRVTFYGLKGPSGIGMLKMMDDGVVCPGYETSFELLAQADLAAGRFIAGDAKIGILPPNVPAKIAASGKNPQIAAITGTGMLSLLSSNPQITKIEDLRGAKVAVAGQGAVPEFVFLKILSAHGLKSGDLTLDFSLAYPEIAQLLIAGRAETALLPEPFATMARSGNAALHDAADVQAEWGKAGGAPDYPMTALVVDGAFAGENPLFVSAILDAYKASIEWVVTHPGEAGALAEKHELGLRAAVVTASIPKSNFVFQLAKDARLSIEALFRAFLEYAPESIGGRLPDDGFYY